MSEKIVTLNEEVIKGQLKELVRGSVEETLNELLQTAIGLPGRTVKDIAAATGILPNTLYKWKTSGKAHLSPSKADRLLLYFIQNKPERLEFADLLQTGTAIHYYKDDTSCLIDRQVPIYERSFPH